MKKYLLALVVIIALAFIAWRSGKVPALNNLLPPGDGQPVACTEEAKQCPDGSYVGRTGPKCEFTACPPVASCEGGACPGATLSDNDIVNAGRSSSLPQLVPDGKGHFVSSLGGGGVQSYSVNKIVRGDLNVDGYEDAITLGTGCGASCGSIINLVLNQKGTMPLVIAVDPEGLVLSGAAQYSIKNITIDKGIVTFSVEIPEFDGQTSNSVFRYKFEGKSLIKIGDASTATGWQTYRNKEYGFEFQYPNGWRIAPHSQIYPGVSEGMYDLGLDLFNPLEQMPRMHLFVLNDNYRIGTRDYEFNYRVGNVTGEKTLVHGGGMTETYFYSKDRMISYGIMTPIDPDKDPTLLKIFSSIVVSK